MKKSFFIIIFFLISFSTDAVDVPKDPVPPVLQDTTVEKKDGSEKGKDKKKKEKRSVNISAVLCDGREVSGKIETDRDELNLSHKSDGILYEKKVSFDDLKQIYIRTWKAERKKKEKDGFTFQFTPSQITVSGKSGDIWNISSLKGTDLSTLSVKNRNGTARLYSFWIDLQYDNGKWFSKLPGFSGNEREDCHPDAFRSIRFYAE
ncbi:MAG TPA: hypothetical protein PL048_14145 [Leptospiraceae bacterium]|nr:hypothetical protein [Leptospiraceae bacterium]HMY67191.1 hypothetical protein [Leptospiraceae bacterium]HMZ59916.1 hypothetical protein [Leptospiraceae bacterium]HNF13527.1 hypothetical protein [Leptospiraceae bacterium]HNH10438.1 hypothetical protein [Leptospiraceae bacterium]